MAVSNLETLNVNMLSQTYIIQLDSMLRVRAAAWGLEFSGNVTEPEFQFHQPHAKPIQKIMRDAVPSKAAFAPIRKRAREGPFSKRRSR